MADIFGFITNMMAYWSGPRLPPELRRLRHSWMGGSMERYASLGLDNGIFEIIVGNIPERCVNPDPAMRRVMSDISAAFFVLEEYRQRGIEVGPNLREPLVRALFRFFKTLDEPHSPAEVRAMVNTYLSRHSVASPIPVDAFFGITIQLSPLLMRLRQIDKERRHLRKKERVFHQLDDVGLLMNEHLDDSRYNHATPLNVRTFAHTGGDGVHFSLMIVDGTLSDDSPVVVTDPTGGNDAHAIVGENLRDFLCFGYHTGYFCFQPLVSPSQRDENLRDLLNGPGARVGFQNDFGHAQPMMRRLREEFDLQPWTEKGRFQSLQEKYQSLLIQPPM